ncbi:TonB-dependent receptor [Thermocrinis sp.]|uniref:TonB-dependent receptor n=1 Tax=Thermocrinis sp. TaxID=2024383 RepID=UPI002FDD046E
MKGRKFLKLALLGAIFSQAYAQELLLKEIEVKGKKESFEDSLEVREVRESSAKDVGEALTKISGLSKFRRGAIANDVLIRAFQKDNINVLIDDAEVHGACPNRMDPPAFHVDFSEVEKIEIIKGPFDVRHQGSMGGLVNIITKKPDKGFKLNLNASVGSFNFINLSPVISYADNRFYGLAGYSYKYSKPYEDGDGKKITQVHPSTSPNRYKPEFINSKAFEINTYWAKFGLKPLENHELELAYTRQSAKHVLYPALMMDADYDDTDRFSFSYKVGKVSDLIKSLNFHVYYTKVEHWMDDRFRASSARGYSKPDPWGMATYAETKTLGGRIEGEIGNFLVGFEAYKRNWDATNYMWPTMMASAPNRQFIIPDVDITNLGVFGEYKTKLSDKLRLSAGLRLDTTKSEANSSKANTNLYFAYKNTRSTSKTDTYPSGNVQIFYSFTPELELFGGLGYGVRVPDQQERYFALNRAAMCNATMPFCAWVGNPELKPSKNTELDLGLKYSSQRLLVKGTAFYSLVKDYITIHRQRRQNGSDVVPGDSAMSYANVDAVFYGFEADIRANLFGNLFLFGGVSYVEGRKDRDSRLNINDKDVAEVPPLKTRLGLRYDTGLWFMEGEVVATATQNKVDSDLKEQKTSGYGVLNLKAGVNWKGLSLMAGVDNVLDKKYYEHTSFIRHPFMTGVKVPEPGRTFFLNASYRF